jgi:hypothetical protein
MFCYHRVGLNLQHEISNKIILVYLKLVLKHLHPGNYWPHTHTLLDPIIRGNVYEEQPSATRPSFVNGV